MSDFVTAVGLKKSFGATHALDGVGIALRSGEIHGLIGENGAGKSTLVRILSGAIRPDSGSIEIDGTEVEIQDPAEAQRLGIAVIYQEVRGVPALDVTRNIALGREPGSRLAAWVDWHAARREAVEVLARVGLDASPDSLLETLGLAERQLVAIAGALARRARLLIMDEPTSALSARDTARLFELMRGLVGAGVTILFVSHRLQEVTAIADLVTVLRDGRLVGTVSPREVAPRELVAMMVGKELQRQQARHLGSPHEGAPLLQVEELSGAAVKDVSLDLWKGEIVGLAGQLGSGTLQVGQLLAGIRPVLGGQVIVEGTPCSIRDPRDATRHGIALVPEDRRQQGLVSQMTVAENVALPRFAAFSRWGLLRHGEIRKVTLSFVELLHIRVRSPAQSVSALSGGNQQKVVMARWLGTQPKVLILNEPTRGVDVGAKADVYDALRRLARDGVAILIASTDVPELVALCDRVLVMRNGAIAATIEGDALTEHNVVAEVTGAVASELAGDAA